MKTPVKNYKQELYPKGDVTQWFAENPKLYAFMGLNGHNGIDIVRPHGENMYAIEDGIVIEVKNDPKGFGKHLRFLSDVPGESGYYHEWTYGHCANIFVAIGDKVTAGQLIATMGNTGFVVSGNTPFWKNNPFAGTHLHLGLRLMKKPRRGGWTYPGSSVQIDVMGYGNGYKGAIDPSPYLATAERNIEAPTVQTLQLTLISVLNSLLALLSKK